MREPEHAAVDARRRRLLYRATHRGTQETDRLIGGYLRPRIDGLSETELERVEAILELPDVDLADWLSGRRPVPPGPLAPLLARMREAARQ